MLEAGREEGEEGTRIKVLDRDLDHQNRHRKKVGKLVRLGNAAQGISNGEISKGQFLTSANIWLSLTGEKRGSTPNSRCKISGVKCMVEKIPITTSPPPKKWEGEGKGRQGDYECRSFEMTLFESVSIRPFFWAKTLRFFLADFARKKDGEKFTHTHALPDDFHKKISNNHTLPILSLVSRAADSIFSSLALACRTASLTGSRSLCISARNAGVNSSFVTCGKREGTGDRGRLEVGKKANKRW